MAETKAGSSSLMKRFKKILAGVLVLLINTPVSFSQINWENADAIYGPLPPSVHVYRTADSIDGRPNIAYYVEADLKDMGLLFTTDTTYERRLTPDQFYQKNDQPLVVVNCTFFSFATNQSLNAVIRDGKLECYNIKSVRGKGADSLLYYYPLRSALGIKKNRKPDIAWLYTDSARRYPFALKSPHKVAKGTKADPALNDIHPRRLNLFGNDYKFNWKMETAAGGGPVLIYDGDILITNEDERMFIGDAIGNKHPRTAMGYTKDHRLIILVIQGRYPEVAEGATLKQEAQILKDLGCAEALNLDGGGSSCMLVNGKETIRPSDKDGQRAIPAVFLIKGPN